MILPNSHDAHVLIVGAGMAGLSAAQELLKTTNIHVTIVEANDYVGGRIKPDKTLVEGHIIETGAELVHGKGTMLTKLIDKYYNEHWKKILGGEEEETPSFQQDYFILSHADGGPDPHPTKDGKYGMHYVNDALIMYDDPMIYPLEKALSAMHLKDDDSVSVDDDSFTVPTTTAVTLGELLQSLPNELKSLAVASYGNTAGCCDLDQISLKMIMDFETYWQSNEEEGDVQLCTKIGMSGVVQELYNELCQFSNFDMKLNWKVSNIEYTNNDDHVDNNNGIRCFAQDGSTIKADYVIITTPPPLWPTFMDLPPKKVAAIERLGMNCSIKCAIKLKKRKWPENVQSIIMADCPIPEMWFHEFEDSVVAIGFLTSQMADEFEVLTSNDTSKVFAVFCQQMQKVLSIPIEDIQINHVETRIYKWNHTYMFPKVGFETEHLKELSTPMQNVHFAGEATNTNACCTVQAAMETGLREAYRILEKIT